MSGHRVKKCWKLYPELCPKQQRIFMPTLAKYWRKVVQDSTTTNVTDGRVVQTLAVQQVISPINHEISCLAHDCLS